MDRIHNIQALHVERHAHSLLKVSHTDFCRHGFGMPHAGFCLHNICIRHAGSLQGRSAMAFITFPEALKYFSR